MLISGVLKREITNLKILSLLVLPRMWCAWRIEHQLLWDKYVVERNDVIRHLRQLDHNNVELDTWRSKLEDSTAGMPDELCAPIGRSTLCKFS